MTGPERCQCKDTLCHEQNTCIITADEGICYTDCSTGFPSLVTSKHCLCNTKVCTTGQGCIHEKSLCLTPPKCPDLPQAAGVEGCLCDSKLSACKQGQVCGVRRPSVVRTCMTKPAPCPPMTEIVKDSGGCYCNVSNSICIKGEICNDDKKSCTVPQPCKHPATLNLNLSTDKSVDHVFTLGDNHTFTCDKYHSLYETQVY